ncbi:MAG: class I SAM-dependent methyltransferase [Candidatus Melainabacteria bacterium]|nr:class I SAM-dependent methyltransferase [Candidatus Melainabacteria bacterium]
MAQAIVKYGQQVLNTELGRKFLTEEVIVSWKRRLAPLCISADLSLLAYMHETDKYGYHSYIKHYQKHFSPLRSKRLNLLEIGVGGYESPTSGGASLRMWKQYFSKGNIFGIDINDKSGIDETRIKTFQGDQSDSKFLSSVAEKIGCIDIIIDDGSHINSHVISSFECLFPLLAENGIYVVEDVQTSYWPNFGGNSNDLSTNATMVGYFKNLVDGLNYQDMVPTRSPNYFDLHIAEICFYHNLILVFFCLYEVRVGKFCLITCPVLILRSWLSTMPPPMVLWRC